MRVHHLNCGTLRPPGGGLIDGRPGLLRRAELVCHCLLLETDDGLVLVETGLGSPVATRAAEWLGPGFTRLMSPGTEIAETAAHQVKSLGYRTEDVRHIVLTHLDLDHAGGLVDFPWARVHVYGRELETFLSPRNKVERHRYQAAHFAHGPQWIPYAEHGERWFGFDAVRQLRGLAPEILLIPLAGHTRGHAGVAVDTGAGWLLHAGDSYFAHGAVDPVRPHTPLLLRRFEATVQMDRRARLDNQRRLRELVSRHGAEVSVFSAHDAAEFHRLRAGNAGSRQG